MLAAAWIVLVRAPIAALEWFVTGPDWVKNIIKRDY
jgi:hypothetical protein